MLMTAGKFITFEGGEGCGKSTQSNMLYQYLLSRNIPVDLTREVGGTLSAEKMREILIYQELLPMSELLQIMAARYEHIHKRIIPKLNAGIWVICDRFIDSTACYQGSYISDKLPQATNKDHGLISIEQVYALHHSLIAPILPDCTFWIDLPPEIALSRAQVRGDTNKFESKDISFHQAVYNRFQYISLRFLDRIVQIPALNLSTAEIHDMIIKFCHQKFSKLIE